MATTIEVPEITFPFTPTAPVVSVSIDPNIPASIVYVCTLKKVGGADPISLPISSTQCRYRNNNADSWLSVVVPNGAKWSSEISARVGGDLSVSRGLRALDGSTLFLPLLTVPLLTVADNWGGSRRSITLSGQTPTNTVTPKSVTLKNPTYRAGGTGKRRFRVDLDLNLRPGDTGIILAESIVVGTILYQISTAGELMEITEV